uniref:Oncoprotein-induced transcript 3 protein-like n=1 Tax=Crassostrea virginica TaxID=6565 RepID=A0A8B8AHJ3_CRAVI|nr:oncoprotein-induced transcript 3 protein-like [Crassostrea virginica]XP_022290013.1 oncoprotein-induced transcript 3 protein-like [Crassostrea virginica]
MSWNIVVFLGVLLPCTEAVYYCNVTDPCGQANSTQFYEPYARFENCPHNSNGFCDRYITPQWYRVDDVMLTKCPQLLTCGTLYPVWLNGTFPNISEGVVDRIACKVSFVSCCSKTYNIQIKNCGSFYAYCLAALDTCPERYCFGEQGTCEVPSSSVEITTTTPATTTTPTPIPTPPTTDTPSTRQPTKAKTKHSHTNVEILLGIILTVLSFILAVLLFCQFKQFKNGQGKTGSIADNQSTDVIVQETRVNPLFDEKREDPPPYSP